MEKSPPLLVQQKQQQLSQQPPLQQLSTSYSEQEQPNSNNNDAGGNPSSSSSSSSLAPPSQQQQQQQATPAVAAEVPSQQQQQQQEAPPPPPPTLSSSLSSSTTTSNQQQQQQQQRNTYQIGQTVTVQRRAWAGINQPGGTARITDIRWVPANDDDKDDNDDNEDEEETNSSSNNNNNITNKQQRQKHDIRKEIVSVRYILDGRREKSVDVQYVSLPQSISRLRNRNNNVHIIHGSTIGTGIGSGRCLKCGSFLRDCGFCYFQQQQDNENDGRRRRRRKNKSSTSANNKVVEKKSSGSTRNSSSLVDFLLSSSSSSSSRSGSSDFDDNDSDDNSTDKKKQHELYQQFKSHQQSSSQSNNNNKKNKKKSRLSSLSTSLSRQRKQQQQRREKKTAKKKKTKKKKKLLLEQESSLMRLGADEEDEDEEEENTKDDDENENNNTNHNSNNNKNDGGGDDEKKKNKTKPTTTGSILLLQSSSSSSSCSSIDDDDDSDNSSHDGPQQQQQQPQDNDPYRQLLLLQKQRRKNNSYQRRRRRMVRSHRQQQQRRDKTSTTNKQQRQGKRFRLPTIKEQQEQQQATTTGDVESTPSTSSPPPPLNQDDDNNNDDGCSSSSSTRSIGGAGAGNTAGSISRRPNENNNNNNNKRRSSSSLSVSSQGSVESSSEDDDVDEGGDDDVESNEESDYDDGDVDDEQEEDDMQFLYEGDEQELPSDVRDCTKGLTTTDALVAFVNEQLDQLQKVKIPAIKAEFVVLERKWRDNKGNDNRQSKIEWYHECDDFQVTLLKRLVRGGVDQCRKALYKLDKKGYITMFDLDKACDDVADDVQQLDKRVNALLDLVYREIEDMGGFRCSDDGGDGGGYDVYNDDVDGWGDPSSQSPTQRDPSESQGLPPTATARGEFDPHPYANRKRKPSDNKMSRSLKLQQILQSKKKAKEKRGKKRTKDHRGEQEKRMNKGTKQQRTKRRRRKPSSAADPTSKRTTKTRDRTSRTSEPPSSSDDDDNNNNNNIFADDDETNTGDIRPARGTTSRKRTNSSRGEDVPPDFNLFEENNDPVHGDTSLQDRSARRNGPSIATRMERFLKANEDNNGPMPASPLETHDREMARKRQRGGHRVQSTRSISGGNRSTTNSSAPTGSVFDGVTDPKDLQKALFSSLGNRQYPEEERLEEEEPSQDSQNISMAEQCARLAESFPDDSSVRILKNIRRMHTAENASTVFGTFIDVLKIQGSETLMALVWRESSSLGAYVCLYATALQMLALGLNCHLQTNDGVAYQIFSNEGCERLIGLILFQLVDVVYAVVHPKNAWALQLENRGRILDSLKPLLFALHRHSYLPEAVCQCLLNELESQSWHLSCDSRHAYISSFPPDIWSTYLSSGTPPDKPSTVRLSSFKGFPECEVAALWSLLAFFSVDKAPPSNDPHKHYWNLVSKVFSQGVLFNDKDCSTLPPSSTQVKTTNDQCRNLVKMLVAETVGSRPRKDTILVNAIRSFVLLQGDDLLHNEDSRRCMFPSLRNEKKDRKLVRSFWRKALSPSLPAEIDASPISLLFHFAEEVGDSTKALAASLGKPSVLPSFGIIRSCAALTAAWIARVPVIESRQARLATAVKLLVNQLVADSSGSHDISTADSGGTRDAFADAFSPSLQRSDRGHAGTGDVRRELALREAAAFLTIISRMAHGLQTDCSEENAHELNESVWELLADGAMKKHRQELISGEHTHNKYSADSLRLLVAARAITFVSLSFLGIPAWTDNLLYPDTFSPFFPQDNLPTSSDKTLYFAYSCLASCLDYACDSSELATSITQFMGILLSRVQRLIHQDDSPEFRQLQPSIRKLRGSVLDLTLSPFCRCFEAITSATCCGAEEGLCLESLLSLMQCVLLIAEPVTGPTETSGGAAPSGNDDMWGGLDDDLFASLELPGESGQKKCNLDCVWDLLSVAVEQAKPSKRFLILPPHGHTAPSLSSNLSPQGRNLIDRYKVAVSSTFVAIAAFEGGSRAENLISRYISSTITDFTGEEDDKDFNKTLAKTISQELVAFSSGSGHVMDAINSNTEPLTIVLFEQFLETSILENLPSCNLSRIGKISGSKGEEKEFDSLMTISQGSRMAVKEACDRLWNSCLSLGQIFHQGRWETLSKCLQRSDPDLPGFRHKLVSCSLEEECLNRFRLFRRVSSLSSLNGLHMVSSVFMSSAYQLGKLQEKFCALECSFNHATNGDTSQTMSLQAAKLLETASCYVESHMSIITWVFRELTGSRFDPVRQIWSKICKGYLAPLAKREALDVRAAVKTIVSGGGYNASHLGQPLGKSTFSDICFEAILRRIREIMICIARSERNDLGVQALFNVLLEASISGTDENAWSFSRAFTGNLISQSPVGEEVTVSSPLQSEIDAYLIEVEGVSPLDKDDELALLELKWYTMESTLIPKLRHPCTSALIKQGILRLLDHMLHLEGDIIGKGARINVQILCSLAQGIHISLVKALSSCSVDDGLIDYAFHCARAMDLPASRIVNNGLGWLIDWCYSKGGEESDDESVELEYLWSFFCWLKDVGEILLGCDERIERFRTELKSLKENEDSHAGGTSSPTASSWNNMMSFEKRVFVSSINCGSTITNTYRSDKDGGLESERSRWSPTAVIRRTITAFVYKVRSAKSSNR